VINAIVTGRWPDGCDESLPIHAAECAVCTELVDVASVLRIDRDGLHEEMSLPSAGQVWWRAAIRTRLEASQRAARPFSWLFGISAACAVGLTFAVVQLLWSPMQLAWAGSSLRVWASWLGLGELTRLVPMLIDLAPVTTTGVLVLLGATACLLLAPLALYFALSDE
jgi:hypothetical protein